MSNGFPVPAGTLLKWGIIGCLAVGSLIYNWWNADYLEWEDAAFDAYRAGDYPKAIELYSQCLAEDDGDAMIHSRMATMHATLGHYKKAIFHCTKEIELGDEVESYDYFIRGEYKVQVKDYSGALNDYHQAIAMEPEDQKYLLCRAKAYLLLHDSVAAETDVQQALSLSNENDRFPFYEMGNVRILAGDTAAACKHWNNFLDEQLTDTFRFGMRNLDALRERRIMMVKDSIQNNCAL